MEKKILAVFLSVLLSATFGASFVVTTAGPEETTLIMGTTDSVESAIDPAQAYDFFGWEIIQNTGCTLVEIELGSMAGAEDFEPALATSWITDGQNWTFTLRQGVLFEDGTEFNASHVKYSFDRSMGIASPDGPQLNMEYDAIIDNVEVVSKYMVRFNLKIPFGPFLGLMACQASSIVNPQYAGGWKTEWSIDDVVWYADGTDARTRNTMDLGPYKLTEWTRVAGKDNEMRLEANPNYWNKGAGLPKTDVVIIKFYADATALRLAIEAGDIDVAFRHITATDIEDLQDNPDVKVWQGTGAAIQYMIFQEDPVGTLPQLNNAKIRRALTACLNRSEVCTTVFLDQMSPLYSIIPTGMMGHTEAFKVLGDANYTYAINELADLGYNETNKLEIELWYESSGHYPSSADQAAVYKSQFEGSGVISVTLQSADWPSYREHRSEGTMHVYLYGWYPDYIDPDNYAFLYWAVWLNHHYIDHGEHYAEMRAAYDAARASSNETERIDLYDELEGYAVLDCPVVPIWQGAAWAVTKPNIKGVYLDVTESVNGLRMWYLTRAPVHNIDMGLDYSTIQEAIDANETLDGHVIFVEAGTYVENVVVNKTVSLIGESSGTTIIDANGTGNVIDVKADEVVIEGFTIQNSGYDASGIQIGNYKQATIRNNNIINNDLGINIWDSRHNSISGNNITNNYYGVILQYSFNNTLRNNHMSGNQRNFFVWSEWPGDYHHDIDSSNTVDGKPMHYWVNQQNRTVPVDAGYVALVYSVNITAQNLDLKNNGQGLLLVETRNSTITGNNLTNNRCGIHLSLSLNNTIFGNNMMNNGDGVLLEGSVNNTIFGNNITNNYCGVDVSGFWVPATNNTIYHNNFIDNTQQVYISTTPRPPNFWDNGLEGNYWSNYTGVDSDHDGIGDTTHEIDADNVDNYPLMGMFSDFTATSEHHVQTICNSTISDFQFNGTAICFNVSGEDGTTGFCRICIPRALMNETYNVFVNGIEVPGNLLQCSNSTHSYLYFNYNLSTQEVIVVPEFPTWTSMLLMLVALTIALAICKRRLLKTPIH
jgi:peptide/nickel transport system substrate-binding protein